MHLGVAFSDFWPGFDSRSNFFLTLLKNYGFQTEVTCLGDADLVIHSVFADSTRDKASRKRWERKVHWFYTGENRRPPVNSFDLSFSFDLVNLENHVRLPLWYLYCDFGLSAEENHADDSRLNPYVFNQNRDLDDWDPEFVLSAYIGNLTPLRNQVINEFKKHIKVELFGSAFQNSIGRKLDNKDKHLFTLCFENEYFPGYHTEKLPQAWGLRSVPLYFGAKTVSRDFNKSAFLNLADFSNTSRFIEFALGLSRQECKDVVSQPIAFENPSLDYLEPFVVNSLKRLSK